MTIFFGSRGVNAIHKDKVNDLKCLPDQPKEVGDAIMERMEEMNLPGVEDLLFYLYKEGARMFACPLNVHYRTWCCFCPIGSMANWVGRKRYTLKIDSSLCTECKPCYKVCPIQSSPFKFKKEVIEIVKDSDCLKCNLCVAICSKNALNF